MPELKSALVFGIESSTSTTSNHGQNKDQRDGMKRALKKGQGHLQKKSNSSVEKRLKSKSEVKRERGDDQTPL